VVFGEVVLDELVSAKTSYRMPHPGCQYDPGRRKRPMQPVILGNFS